MHQHTSILLHIESGICLACLHLWIRLQLKGWRVAVRCSNHEAMNCLTRNTEGNDRGFITYDEVLTTLCKLPAAALR